MASDDAHGDGGAPSGAQRKTDPRAATLAAGSGSGAAELDPMIGTVIDDRYRVMAKIGEGGMGEVYLAEHLGLKKRRAIKLLRAEIVSNEEAVRRFYQEAQSASSIGHRNIIEIVDIGKLPDGRVYMCMEFLEGKPFNELIKEPLDPGRVLNILIQSCHGLAAAHRQQIVHRDMKPENIFVTHRQGQDVPKLLDFGIAKVSGNDGQNNLTRTGTIFGTPFYMAPEQALGQQVDHRADIYSLGVIMYEVFTGSVPFKAESFMAILTQHITTEPKPPHQMAAEMGRVVPPQLEPIIVRCMRKQPEERYQTMDELIAALVEGYRSLAGPGMSAYFDAQTGFPSAAHQMSGPYTAGHVAQPTPQPTPTPSQSYGYAQPGMGTAPPYAAAPKKRKGALIAVLFVLFLAGGGAAGYFVWQSQQGDDSGEAVAATGGGKARQGTDDGGDDGKQPIVVPPDDGTDDGTDGADGVDGTGDDGADATDVTDDGTGDDGADATDVTDDATDIVVEEPPKKKVLVNSRPQGATVIVNGERLGETPLNVDVVVGEQVDIRLERRGYHSESFTIDGKKARVTERLRRDRQRPDRGGDKDDKDDGTSGTGTGTGTGKDDGKKDDKDDTIEEGLIDDDSDILE